MISVINPNILDYLEALDTAHDVCNLLTPFCERVDIAGSIRRKEKFVHDIEIVCLPKTIIHFKQEKYIPPVVEPLTLFEIAKEESERELNKTNNTFPEVKKVPVQGFIDLVLSWTKVKGEPLGRYTRRVLPNGCKLDLFIPAKSDYYRQLAIRTGSADYSRYVIARSWKRRGWCGTADGLRLIEECEQKNNTWKCIVEKPTLPPEWESEKEFFDFICVAMMSPEWRIVTKHEINTIHNKKHG